ncbi:MAG: membrane protein insertase YidC [Elusimicrobia bacterium]|nr:membrane protein insertase YidC [Elusimicrobiota bacterium]
MTKNYAAFFISSVLILLLWFWLNPPAPQAPQQHPAAAAEAQIQREISYERPAPQAAALRHDHAQALENLQVDEQEFVIETEKYKVVLTNRGAAIRSFMIREVSGLVDLVAEGSPPVMANFPGANFAVNQIAENILEFTHASPQGWTVVKTYTFSKTDFLHDLQIELHRTHEEARLPGIDVSWGPGLGTAESELRENLSVTRVTALPRTPGERLRNFRNVMSEPADLFRWAAIDNRYFLVAFIPERPADFSAVTSSRRDRNSPYTVTLNSEGGGNENMRVYNLRFYVGPKGYSFLRTYGLGLEHTVEFGRWFSFLGRTALSALMYLYGITGNFGWAIIMLTVMIQILVFPLTLKSFRATAAMKHIQPKIKEIQAKFKQDPQRLSAEMMNLYKTQKVNPLGGCLPMLLQLPIFWAFFTMLRNAYEIRNAPWILWVSDLSMPDALTQIGGVNLNVLPLVMGLGMFFQQRMTAVTADPMQQKIMMWLPVIFTFMFWRFPSGLVLYWLTNSICSMTVQFFVLKKDAKNRAAQTLTPAGGGRKHA